MTPNHLIGPAVILILIIAGADFLTTGRFDPMPLASAISALLLCGCLYRLVTRRAPKPPKRK